MLVFWHVWCCCLKAADKGEGPITHKELQKRLYTKWTADYDALSLKEKFEHYLTGVREEIDPKVKRFGCQFVAANDPIFDDAQSEPITRNEVKTPRISKALCPIPENALPANTSQNI